MVAQDRARDVNRPRKPLPGPVSGSLAGLLSTAGVRYGEPVSCSGLTLIPVFHTLRASLDYLLLAQAVAAGSVAVTEVGGGTVPSLRIHNSGDKPVLLVDGEHLVGVKQNRILNTTILVPEKSTLDIPVSCVEAGRWGAPLGAARPVSPHLFVETRAEKAAAVTASVRESGVFAADQAAIWEGVSEKLEALDVEASTSAMHAAYEQRAGETARYLERLQWQPGQAGVVAAVGDRIVCADLFDRPETLEALWDRLVPSYAVEAMAGAVDGTVTAERAAGFVLEALHARMTAHPAVGRGTDLRLTGTSLVGAALEVEGAILHLALFRVDRPEGRPRGSGFATVEERRRRMRSGGGDLVV